MTNSSTPNTPANGGQTHELKTDPAVFDAVARGEKTHEIRFNDRGFAVGDALLLRETLYSGELMKRFPDDATLVFTGREATRTISHIQTGYGLADGWCILSFAPVVANGGQILTDERIIELRDIAGVRYASVGNASHSGACEFARLIEADLRASLAAPAIPTVDRNAVLEQACLAIDALNPSTPQENKGLIKAIKAVEALKSAAPATPPVNLIAQEEAAKAIYRLFDGAEAHPWVNGGNSNKQDEARRYARVAISVAQPAAQVAVLTNEQGRDRLILNLERGRGGENEDDWRDAETTEAYAFFDRLADVVSKANPVLATPATVKTAEGQ